MTRMRFPHWLALSALTLFGLPSYAVLKVGDPAPAFDTEAALGGKAFTFSLADTLKKGPVVLYFYPKAFTSGCTVEAHEFAEATERFTALGATVVGMSGDDIGTLKKFSVEACRNKFAVAADGDGKVIRQYDVALSFAANMADRVSYVISPEGKVIYTYSSPDPSGHITNTLKAVERWKAANRP
jgi:peroxiredoxin